ncbi:hypothetical protein GJ496_009509 [Pomphorhynchus laevis]|nr:hypothetical protein GJ496_009509 [Pomphorhynchus laevis]
MTFFDHLERVACRVASRACAAQLLSSATYDVALKFFHLMLRPIVSYGLSAMWQNRMPANFKPLNRIKWSFIKMLSAHSIRVFYGIQSSKLVRQISRVQQ